MNMVAVCDDNKHNKITGLCFSTTNIKAVVVSRARDYQINQPSIVINVGQKFVTICDTNLVSWQSAIFQNTHVNLADTLLVIYVNVNNFLQTECPFANEVIKNWTHIYDIYPLPQYKKTQLWRSDKQQIGKSSFNLWFAKAGTNCGIHNKHDFKEIHTQIYGIGRMQKFANKNIESLYQETYMAPGFTHEPFYDENTKYPYHQYFADTDCIWLARES